MTERPSAERLAYLRRRYAHDEDARELFTELDAVTRERDEALKAKDDLRHDLYMAERQRDEAREWREAWIDGKRKEQEARDRE